MQVLNKKKITKKEFKKSRIMLFGSLLIFIGFVVISYNHLLKIRGEVYSDMMIAISDSMIEEPTEEVEPEVIIEDVPVAENIQEPTAEKKEEPKKIDYSKYLGVLEIPRIGLKRGFFGLDSKYNTIEYNVTLVNGSTMPDVSNGNLILMAHSGDAYISYFENLYKLAVGDMAYITHKGTKYSYKIVNIYNVEKNGRVTIYRNYDKTTLTLITCTNHDSTTQTIYIAELESIE